MKISFYSEFNYHTFCEIIQLKNNLKKIARAEKCSIDYVNFNLISKRNIYKINKKFLRHFYTTDIITFNYSSNKKIRADIYICIPVVKENSKVYNVSFVNELKRVLIHGLLHCIGYDDKTKKERIIMRFKEDKYIKTLK